MTNKSKAKGTRAESAVVNYLRQWWPNVERRTMSGSFDKGDIAGLPLGVVEVKDCKAMQLATWVDEALAETINADADFGVVWHKRARRGSPADWYVTLDGATFVQLLREHYKLADLT